jgi:carbamoyl-phosphate synthase large subunit
VRLPREGTVFISVNEKDKEGLIPIARDMKSMGYHLYTTTGTHEYLKNSGIETEHVFKVGEGRPNIVDLIKSKKIDLIINTPLGQQSRYDERAIRRAATQHQVACITTLSGAAAASNALQTIRRENLTVRSLQEYHGKNRIGADGKSSEDYTEHFFTLS